MELFTNNYTNHDIVGVIVFASVMVCVAATLTAFTIYIYRVLPDPLNDNGVVHLTELGNSAGMRNRPLSPLTFANVDQPGLYGNVGNVGDNASLYQTSSVNDNAASTIDYVPSMLEATPFSTLSFSHACLMSLWILVPLMVMLPIILLVAFSLMRPLPPFSLIGEYGTCAGSFMSERVKDYYLILLVRYSHISPTKTAVFRVILRLIFS